MFLPEEPLRFFLYTLLSPTARQLEEGEEKWEEVEIITVYPTLTFREPTDHDNSFCSEQGRLNVQNNGGGIKPHREQHPRNGSSPRVVRIEKLGSLEDDYLRLSHASATAPAVVASKRRKPDIRETAIAHWVVKTDNRGSLTYGCGVNDRAVEVLLQPIPKRVTSVCDAS